MNLSFTRKLLLSSLLCFSAAAVPLHAQRMKHANLTEAEIDQIRESAVYPDERIKLYTKFLDERAARIKDLSGRPKSAQRSQKLDGTLQDFTLLMDEAGSNLDVYSDRHSDIRKSLKLLSEASARWVNILRALPGEPTFDLARKEAIESGEELADQSGRLFKEQDDWFATHKKEKGQERDDPSPSTPNPHP